MPTTSTPASTSTSYVPAPGQRAIAPRIPGRTDVRDMFVVHTGFRRDFFHAPRLVREVRTGDLDRARLLGEHVTLITDLLHHHHTGEDELLWPLLLERVPEQLAPIVELMEAHHCRIHELLQALPESLARFTESADADSREQLAVLLDDVYVVLDEHITAEEEQLLPIAANYVTTEEWARLGRRGAKLPLSQQLIVLGSLLYQGDPDVLRAMLSEAPFVLRVVLPPFARRAFARRARQVYGTATP